MKKIIVLLATVALFTGCAATESIKRLETQGGSGIFTVVSDTRTAPPAGYGDLRITLSLKTRVPDSSLVDADNYGTKQYKLLVGVNGQTQTLTGAMTQETGDYRGSSDPEAGNGVRYRFASTLRLPVGTHRVTIALPGDNVVLERDVTVAQGVNQLDLKPVYGRKSSYNLIGFHGERTYYKGVKALTVSGQVD